MKTLSLNMKILLGAVLGVLFAVLLRQLPSDSAVQHMGLIVFNVLANLFVDLLKMILVPLIFTSIVVGVANLRMHQQIQQVWVLTLGFFVLSMGLAIVLGLSAARLFAPGKGLNLTIFQEAMKNYPANHLSLADFTQTLLHGLFVNPFAALAQSNVLAIVIFALFIGIALVKGGQRYQNIIMLLQEWQELTLVIVGWIMHFAPFGIMALLAKLVLNQDLALLATVGKFIAVVLATTLLHGVIVLPLLGYWLGKMPPMQFWRGAKEALITAFATSSSSATVPVTLRCTEQHLHVKPEIAGFVIPLGATVNMDGTALYEAAAALFVANLSGVELNLAQQFVVSLTAMLAAIGAPGIPSAGMVTMVLVLQAVGLPTEAIAILLPIDRLLDTVRTAVNVEGDMVCSVIVQRLVAQDTQQA